MNKRILILLVALVAVLAVAGAAYKSLSAGVQMDNLSSGETVSAELPQASEETQPVDLAPDFTVYDREGNAYALSDFRGQKVIVNFWASWCGPCKSEMPDFQDKFLEYGDEIQFPMVNLTDGYQETVSSAAGFIDNAGYTFPVYFDTDLSGASAYGVNAVPVTYFIDERGVMIAYGKGAMSADVLQRGIDMLIG